MSKSQPQNNQGISGLFGLNRFYSAKLHSRGRDTPLLEPNIPSLGEDKYGTYSVPRCMFIAPWEDSTWPYQQGKLHVVTPWGRGTSAKTVTFFREIVTETVKSTLVT